mmetsp:Transcript_35279/g.77272  ORF Transcript_35279/g.77272 Transcript_35279/m.77272 type:complete len:135 (-) Transcript_35279:405-809(-)
MLRTGKEHGGPITRSLSGATAAATSQSSATSSAATKPCGALATSPSPPPSPPLSSSSGTNPADPSEELSKCLLSQYKYCVAGLAAGGAYSYRTRTGVVPLFAAGVAGSLADIMWGLMVDCKDEVEAYKKDRGMD